MSPALPGTIRFPLSRASATPDRMKPAQRTLLYLGLLVAVLLGIGELLSPTPFTFAPFVPIAVVLALVLPVLLPAAVPLVPLWLELLALLPGLKVITGAAASCGVPNPVDASEQADNAPSTSAKHETGIERAVLFFMINPGAGRRHDCEGDDRMDRHADKGTRGKSRAHV